MSTGKHVSRISAESQWQEGIFLGILGGRVGASEYAIGTPDGVQPARAIKMVPEIDAWDIEWLLAVKGLRIRLPAPEVPPEHVLPPVGEPVGPRSRRIYIRRDVEIRKYGVTIGCPLCMAITAGTTAQGHSDECRARTEQKMLEDVTGEGAMRLEEASRRKRGRPDDESGRVDVEMETAAINPIRPFQYGGSSSSWEVRPEPSRRREAEEQLGGDVVRARLQNPQGVVRATEQARLQPREELEAALDSICKHVKELGAWNLDCLKAVKELPGVVVVRCDQRLCGLMKRWFFNDGGWGERQSTQRTGWMASMIDLAGELSEVQNLDQSLTTVFDHARDRTLSQTG